MTTELLSALFIFALVGSITPGPNIMLVLASGVNFGLRRTIPHMLGISIGFSVMLGLVGIGIAQVFAAFPFAYEVLRVVAVAYMLWLAWKIANAGPIRAQDSSSAARPMTFLEAAAFQWINPKAWTLCLATISAYTVPGQFYTSLIAVMGVFTLANLPSLAIWVAFGVALRKMLSDQHRVRIFNYAMALALVLSIWPLVADVWQ